MPAALALAHLALAAALILALAAALIVLFLATGLATGLAFFILAQRFLCAAATLDLPAALIPRRLAGFAVEPEVPTSEASWLLKASILSLMLAAFMSCAEVKDSSVLIVVPS